MLCHVVVLLCYVMCDIMPCHVISCRVMFCRLQESLTRVVSCPVGSSSRAPFEVMSCPRISCRVGSPFRVPRTSLTQVVEKNRCQEFLTTRDFDYSVDKSL